MQITIKAVSEPVWKSKGKQKWQEISITYEGDKGEKSKTFPSFVDLYKSVSELEVGATYDVRMQKEGDYFQWVGVEKLDVPATRDGGRSSSGSPRSGGSVGGNDWAARNQLDRDRFVFEQEKQILIIRQSQVTNAISAMGPGHSPRDYADFAEALVNYVTHGVSEVELAGAELAVKRGPGRPKKNDAPAEPDVE